MNLDTVIAEVIARYPDLAADDDRARFILGNLTSLELVAVLKNRPAGTSQLARLMHEFDTVVAPSRAGHPPIRRPLLPRVRRLHTIPDEDRP